MCRFTIKESNFYFLRFVLIALISISVSNVYGQCEISCLGKINVSINNTCEAEITPAMIVTTGNAGVVLELITSSGDTLDNTTVDLGYVGQQLTVKATEPICSNTCWGIAVIEDKIAPQIMCQDVTIDCAELIVFMDPVPMSCDITGFKVLSETTLDISCESDLFQQVITRTYQAYDSVGNVSTPCTQSLTIEKFDIGLVDFPIISDTTLYCGGMYETDEDGNPKFDILGGPTLSGEDLYPDQFIACNTYVSYSDEILQFNNCVTNVLRTWTVQSWFCGQDQIRDFNQLYTIVDTVGPVIANCPSNITLSTAGNACVAYYNVPALSLSDICNNDVSRVDINYTGGFIENKNGDTTIHLVAGINTVQYIAFDECGNTSTCSYEVLVVDNAEPVTICDQFTTISVSNDGTALLSADDLDDGSFDECSPITLEIRRMSAVLCVEDDDEWQEAVTFCCDDIGTDQMVALRVTDASLNSNICMGTVEVQDKLAPIILAGLPDITVSCTFPFDPDNLTVFGKVATREEDRDPIMLSSEVVKFGGPAFDALILDNCSTVASDEISAEFINQCGLGFVIRTIITANPQGQSVSITQRIDFANNAPFIEDSITWPLDYYPTSSCRPEDLQPEDLPAPYNYPSFVEDACDMIGVTYKDKIITNTPDGGGCFKILRTWYVSDWCQDINNKFPVWTDEQIIEVTNSIAPTIDSGTDDMMVCVYDAECGPGFIDLAVTGSDDCVDSTDLIWKYEIDFFSDNTIDSVGNSSSVSGEFAVGVHTITWILTDGCGNIDSEEQVFEIRNCKNPTPYCYNGLSAALTAMDTSGNGTIDAEMLILTPDFIDVGSFHPCGYDVLLSFSADVNDTVRIYNCSDIGQQPLQLWVTDVVNGNQDFCATYIIIEDNNEYDFCTSVLQTFALTGRIVTDEDEGIQEVAIKLNGTDNQQLTDETGRYNFSNLTQGMSFSIVPDYNVEPANGVSTLDLILIQKHILGLENIENPYRIIAADVNNSGDISASDLISLRKLILGKNEAFPNNKSWRFVDADHQFVQSDNPWANAIPELYEIGVLESHMDINFVGLKVGDVNSSVVMNGNSDAVIRSNSGLLLSTDNRILRANEPATVSILAAEKVSLLGYQVAIKVDPKHASISRVNGKRVTENIESVGTSKITSGIITTNDFYTELTEFSVGETVIELTIVPLADIELKDILSIEHDALTAEMYTAKLEEKGVQLEVRDNPLDVNTNELLQNTPNPWSNETVIRFNLKSSQSANINIYDVTGKRVKAYSNTFSAGSNALSISREEIGGNGIYYYELITQDFKAVRKMILNQ